MATYWLKHREIGDEDWDFEVFDCGEMLDDDFHSDPTSEEGFDACINGYLQSNAACLYGDRYFGSEHEWEIVDRPDKAWLKQELRVATTAKQEATARYNETLELMMEYGNG